MKLLLFLALGGAAGTLARYGLGGLVQPAGSSFPWGTLVVNIAGSFALGFLMRWLLGSGIATPELRAALTVGFCGAFTTMSSFSYETVALLESGESVRAAAYVAGTLGASLAGVFSGLALGGRLL